MNVEKWVDEQLALLETMRAHRWMRTELWKD